MVKRYHCSTCKGVGHNARRCGVGSVPVDLSVKRKRVGGSGSVAAGVDGNRFAVLEKRVHALLVGADQDGGEAGVEFGGLGNVPEVLWLVSEEYPKASVIQRMLAGIYEVDEKLLGGRVVALPSSKGCEHYEYVLTHPQGRKVFILLGRGTGAMVDYVAYAQERMPDVTVVPQPVPVWATEVTKTDGSESGNSAGYQRQTKSVAFKQYHPDVPVYMFGDHHKYDGPDGVPDLGKAPRSHQFGLLLSDVQGVKSIGGTPRVPEGNRVRDVGTFLRRAGELLGHNRNDKHVGLGFTLARVEEDGRETVIDPKDYGEIEDWGAENFVIYIDARLNKPDKGKDQLSHDPNIGFVSSSAWSLRSLGFKGRIVVRNHGLPSDYFERGRPDGEGKVSGGEDEGRHYDNKAARVFAEYGVILQGVKFNPGKVKYPGQYWMPEGASEKIATIRMQVLLEDLKREDGGARFTTVYDNHAGCERSYLRGPGGEEVQVPGKVRIPDLVVYDTVTGTFYICEGKKLSKAGDGVRQLKDYGPFVEELKKQYPDAKVELGLVTYGGALSKLPDREFALMHVNDDGTRVATAELEEILATPKFSDAEVQ